MLNFLHCGQISAVVPAITVGVTTSLRHGADTLFYRDVCLGSLKRRRCCVDRMQADVAVVVRSDDVGVVKGAGSHAVSR